MKITIIAGIMATVMAMTAPMSITTYAESKAEFSCNGNLHITSDEIHDTGYVWYTQHSYYTTDLDKYQIVNRYVVWEVTPNDDLDVTLSLLDNFEDVEVGWFGNYQIVNPTGRIIKGDTNCDGALSIADAVITYSIALKNKEVYPWVYGRADMTGDGVVNVFDVNEVRKFLVASKGDKA